MAGCAKAVTGVSGSAHGPVNSELDLGRLIIKAIGRLILAGQPACSGNCDSGTCTFGLTSLNGDINIMRDADGGGATVRVTGDGNCYCK